MIKVKVTMENGDSFVTGINATFEEAKEYYLNGIFNMGVVEDNMQRCIKVELV